MHERQGVLPVQALLNVYRRSGTWGLVLWTTAVSVVLSLVIGVGIGLVPLWLMGQVDQTRFISSLAVTIAVPAMVAPPVSWAVAVLLRALSEANEQLTLLAATDELTGVLNRRGFFEAASTMIAETRTPAFPVLGIVDLDRFKQLNDDHGHEAGDKALIAVGARLRELAGSGAVVARFGGDEFAVLVPSSGGETAVRAQLTERLDQIVLPGGIRVGLSIGVTAVEPGESLDLAMARADSHMYRTKQASTVHRAQRSPIPHARIARHRREVVG